MELEFESPKVCDNPAGMCSKLFKDDPFGWLWKIDNARWFSTQPDQCNKASKYIIGGTTRIHAAHIAVEDKELTVEAHGGCLNGTIHTFNHFSGELSLNCFKIKNSNLITCTFTQGTLTRNLQTAAVVFAKRDSQYYNSIEIEEKFHASQKDNPNHWFYKKYFKISDVLNYLNSQKNKKFSSEFEARSFAKDVETAYIDLQTKKYSQEMRKKSIFCRIEKEAKIETNQTHLGKLECSYPFCR